MPIFPIEYIHHILDEVDYLLSHSRSLEKEVFLRDETLQRAFVRSLEIIGEAVKKVPPEFKQQNPEIEWRAMAGMRDKLIHDYFGIDYDLVWDVIQSKIPILA
jgi:uncharacterized protein with HEPN domain